MENTMIARTPEPTLAPFGFAQPRPVHAPSTSVMSIDATPASGGGWIGGTGVANTAADRAYCADLGTGATRSVANHSTAAVAKQDRPPRGIPR